MEFAATLGKAQSWPIVHACSVTDLSKYQNWVLVGGQYANPVYKQVFGDALSESDDGFVRIVRTDFGYQGVKKTVWGVAGWSGNDTIQSVVYVVTHGLPKEGVRVRY